MLDGSVRTKDSNNDTKSETLRYTQYHRMLVYNYMCIISKQKNYFKQLSRKRIQFTIQTKDNGGTLATCTCMPFFPQGLTMAAAMDYCTGRQAGQELERDSLYHDRSREAFVR